MEHSRRSRSDHIATKVSGHFWYNIDSLGSGAKTALPEGREAGR